MELARVEADAVVLAVPAHAAAEILAGEVPEAATVLRAIPYADAVSVTLAFPAAGFPPLEGHGLLFAAGEGKGVRGFTWVHRKWPERAPPGTPLVRAFFDENQAGRPDEELVALARGTLEDLVGTVPEHERVWTFRWPDGLPQYTMGHPARMRSLAAALARLPHVRVAGAAYRGIGVPDVVRDGRDAARAALASLDRRRSS
jgi:oxygen-dependent protoporphyrinogen oxidase